MKDLELSASQIVEDMLSNLHGRAGVGDELAGIDEQIYSEMKVEIVSLVVLRLRSERAGCAGLLRSLAEQQDERRLEALEIDDRGWARGYEQAQWALNNAADQIEGT